MNLKQGKLGEQPEKILKSVNLSGTVAGFVNSQPEVLRGNKMGLFFVFLGAVESKKSFIDNSL